MTVSVAISTRNRPDVLRRCIEALMEGTILPDEIVIVDQSDGDSTRDIVEVARRSGAPLLYELQPYGGLGTAQNTCFAAATSEVVAVVDDDCVPAADWLETVTRELCRDGAPQALTGRVLPLGPNRPDRYPVASRTSTVRREYAGKSAPWDVGSGNNFAVRKDWFLRIEGCDERLGPGAPGQGGLDMDLFYRLLREGARIGYEPDAIVYHERATRRARRDRRYPYGYGMGAATMLWLRERDWYSLRVLIAWFQLRGSIALRSVARGRWQTAQEEVLVLGGTLAGMIHGARSRSPRMLRAPE